ncbi:DNA-directed RNA polymerase specialized sigma24 family protein [Streptomyces sp. PvR006]|uniref:hypothetical protein n=1 Tax=Streptomyces sp. PvR006 TaxID=2817860 RepID=UPI001AE424AB|nr:hypothetical protein [Streptomyces sp. PvR006]MBP2586992.1 DNA-directed RNA polymerase specialized sigma24 family protein [Streptomyces sp. PvR006]
MQSHDTSPSTDIPHDASQRPGRNEAEAALVEHYPRLVRLAHLILPPALGRHRRVLAAHALVQKSLSSAAPSRPAAAAGPTVPAQRGESGPVLAWLRHGVVSAALRAAGRPRWSLGRTPFPTVLGLRLFPGAGGDDELVLESTLATVTPEVRAAFALRVLEGLTAQSSALLLAAAGVSAPEEALRVAERIRSTVGRDAESLLHGAEFDPCTVQARPTDLLRRRHRTRLTALAAAVLLAASTTAVLALRPEPSARPAASLPATALAAASARAADPGLLLRTPADRWADTARVDLTQWPARGAATGDTALLTRALNAWARVTGDRTGDRTGVRLTVAPDTPASPPAAPARLLFAGPVDGSAVVLLHDGERIIRYAEALSGPGEPTVELARTDDADVTTGAAVAVSRSPLGVRFLLAPWIDESTVRDLLRPDVPAQRLAVSEVGVTDPVPQAPNDCGRVPALQVRSSTRIVEDHSFLLTDLGELSPTHLTWTPAPGTGAPARQPREATSAAGLAAWARSACALQELRGTGVRAVNRWEFAQQTLPERAGRATWTCTRAESWDGRGRVAVAWEGPDARSRPVRVPGPAPEDTAACSRFGQHLLAGTYWTAPSGARYYLAAGSRAVTAITARGPVAATVRGPALAVRTNTTGSVRLTGTVPGSGELRGWGEEETDSGGS